MADWEDTKELTELEKAKKTIDDMEAQLKDLKTKYRIMELEGKVESLNELVDFYKKKLAHETEMNRWRKHHHAAAVEEVRILRPGGRRLSETEVPFKSGQRLQRCTERDSDSDSE